MFLKMRDAEEVSQAIEAGREALSRAVLEARNAAGESQDSFSLPFGLSQQSVARWEIDGKIARKHWDVLKEKYGIDPDNYLDEADELRRDFKTVYRSRQKIYGDGNIANVGGRVATATFGTKGTVLSPIEQTLIDELRSKDPDGVLLREILADLLKR